MVSLFSQVHDFRGLKNKKKETEVCHLQVKILNKLAAARAAGQGSGSKVLTDLVEGLEEPKVALELRLKIDKNHPDLKGRYD